MTNIIKIYDNVSFEGNENEMQSRERGYFIRGYVNRPNDDLSLLLQGAQHWAFVWHDKDDKEPHCHIIVRFANNKTPTAMARILRHIDKKQNWHFSCLRDKYSAFDYLYHRDEKSISEGKHRYNDGDVLTDDIAFFTRGGQGQRDNLAFYNDLVVNSLSHSEMGQKYGRDYMKNYLSYDRFARTIREEEREEQLRDARTDLVRYSLENGTLGDLVYDVLDAFATRIITYGVIPSRIQINNYIDTLIAEQKQQ